MTSHLKLALNLRRLHFRADFGNQHDSLSSHFRIAMANKNIFRRKKINNILRVHVVSDGKRSRTRKCQSQESDMEEESSQTAPAIEEGDGREI
jgi:hypothetical protein